jgi:hypothetical protein
MFWRSLTFSQADAANQKKEAASTKTSSEVIGVARILVFGIWTFQSHNFPMAFAVLV